jgi:hypothetical protein
MAPITKLTRKIEKIMWIKECYKAWELIKHKYIEAPILMAKRCERIFENRTNLDMLLIKQK